MGKILRAPAKMRSLLLCLLLAAAATAWPHLLQDEPMLNDEEVDDLAHRQQVVNRLLYKVSENITFPGLRKSSRTIVCSSSTIGSRSSTNANALRLSCSSTCSWLAGSSTAFVTTQLSSGRG